MRDALKVKGQLEILQNKSKLLKDDTWCQGEDYENLKEEVGAFEEEMAKRLDSIKRDKVNWSNDDAGINVDEELDEEEIGMRLTKLTPDQRRGGDRGQRGSG